MGTHRHKEAFRLPPGYERESYSSRRQVDGPGVTLTRVETLRSYLTRHWLDLALVVFAIIGVFESLGRGSGGPGLLGPPWVEAVATSALLLPLLARRRFPFAAPCMVWVVGAALSFVDGALVVASFAVFAAGITAACLFGGLTDVVRARVGLLIVLLGSAIVVANDPRHTADQFVTIPATFTVAWLAGRTHLVPTDIHAVAREALGHRIFFTPVYELRRAQISAELIAQILERVATPR